ncbi:hypothetical protein MC64_020930 [Aeromonas caviae]|uniref:hypothetical protein n=1 Tax=Aeromonas TaxID=642 RepID=UPI00053707F8|nr:MULTISPECIES: hypothetical protein [Aeromonas]MCD6616814.1 hypothetical protein [Aeromonas veronii]PNO57727.1 hypothetical protein MC64_020930 [Aeromonas caviae]QUM00788.1 hypothetical protein IMO17_16630 [Aeromonas caviae]ULH01919.1 hypothetical protein MF133_17415 [Aeromonas caviae]
MKEGDSDNPLLEALKNSMQEVEKKSSEHEKLRASEEYQSELAFLRQTVRDLIHTLRLCEFAASRWQDFGEKYLLPRHFDDIVEAALTAQLAVENGALNPARRELRYMLEVAVNVTYVDEVRAKDSFDERVAFYRGKKVNKSNVDHVFDLPLRLFGEHKNEFATSVRSAWVRASNYVHLTKRRIDEKLRLREQGISLGMETVDMLKDIVSEANEVCSIVVALTFETIGPSFTGDLLVDSLDEQDEWAFHANGYIALIDSHFDYKHERQGRLEEIHQRRENRIKYRV